MFKSKTRSALAIAFLLSAPFSARAVDGATPINQTSAEFGQVTPSDSPGFPITLDAPGHYVLTGNLDLPDANTDGVVFVASQISLDLNGFQIGCQSCAIGVAGTGRGVAASTAVTDASLSNGTIQSVGFDGVTLIGDRTRIEGVRTVVNGGAGIRVGQNARVERSVAIFNLGSGIRAGAHSVVSESISARNNDKGIVATIGAVIERNVVSDNASDGIEVDLGSTLTANVSAANARYGLTATNASITNNAVVQNVDAGIRAEDSVVIANVSTSNGIGLFAPSPTTGYGNNVFTGNNAMGNQVSGGLSLDDNVCERDLVCP